MRAGGCRCRRRRRLPLVLSSLHAGGCRCLPIEQHALLQAGREVPLPCMPVMVRHGLSVLLHRPAAGTASCCLAAGRQRSGRGRKIGEPVAATAAAARARRRMLASSSTVAAHVSRMTRVGVVGLGAGCRAGWGALAGKGWRLAERGCIARPAALAAVRCITRACSALHSPAAACPAPASQQPQHQQPIVRRRPQSLTGLPQVARLRELPAACAALAPGQPPSCRRMLACAAHPLVTLPRTLSRSLPRHSDSRTAACSTQCLPARPPHPACPPPVPPPPDRHGDGGDLPARPGEPGGAAAGQEAGRGGAQGGDGVGRVHAAQAVGRVALLGSPCWHWPRGVAWAGLPAP